MKNILFPILATTLVWLSITTISAQTTTNSKEVVSAVEQPAGRQIFVDSNHDGICDNYATRPANGQGRSFVDANNDGKCDNFSQNNRKGRGQGVCQGNRHGRGQGFRHGRGGRNNGQPAINQQPVDQKK